MADYLPFCTYQKQESTMIQKDLPDDQRVYYPRRDRCQFSWYCDGKGDDPREGSRLWEDAQELAKYVLLRQEELPDITDGALHYHASYIDAPKWAKKQKITTKIDTHIFYRLNSMRL